MTSRLLAVVMGIVVLTACSPPALQGQPKGEATSTEQTSTEQGASSADQSPVATTEHDNNVTFIQGPHTCVSSANFIPQDSNITGGQPWGGVSTIEPYNGQVFSLDAKAGRHDSSGPANWFNQRAPQYLAMFNGPINNLNFAFTGELTLNGDTYLIALGQGNAGGGSSPWWLGGQGFQLETDQGWSHLYTPDGKYFLTTAPYQFGGGEKDDTFYMFAANCGQGTSSALGSESNSTNFEYILDIQNNTKIGMDVITYEGGEGTTYRLERGAHGRYVTRRDISVDSNEAWPVMVAPDNYTPNDEELNLFLIGYHGDFLNSDSATFAGYEPNGAYVFGDPNNPRKNFDFSGYWHPPGVDYAIAGGGDVAQGAGFHAHITFNPERG